MQETEAMEPLRCGEDRRDFDWEQPLAVDGWGFTLAGARFIPAEVAGLHAADVPGLELKWAFAYPGATRDCQPPSPRSLA